MSTILGLIGLSPTSLIAIGGGILAALAWLWRTKRASYNKGRAEQKAETDADNRDFIEEHDREKADVDRMSPSAVDRELSNWARSKL